MYLLIVRFQHLSHILSHYVKLHARLFGSMRAVLHAYLVGSILSLSLPLHALPLCALETNNGSDVCASSECPDEIFTGSSELSMFTFNRQFRIIIWHVFQIVFCDFVPEEEAISCLKKKQI